MKYFFLVISVAVISCCSAKKTAADDKSSSVDVSNKENADTSLPACVQKLVDRFKKEEKQNPPRAVYRYTYQNKTVYYVPAICCDFFSDLYDAECNLIGHPDGGFTGRGDGSMSDFTQTRTSEKLIWKDER